MVVDTVALLPLGGVIMFVPIWERIGPTFPYKLEPGSNVSWYLTGGSRCDTSRELAGGASGECQRCLRDRPTWNERDNCYPPRTLRA